MIPKKEGKKQINILQEKINHLYNKHGKITIEMEGYIHRRDELISKYDPVDF